jgi:hypothetical protein
LPASRVRLSVPRLGLAWRSSLPRPERTETETPFASRTVGPSQDRGAAMEGPRGLALRPHGLGQHPRRTPSERTRACGRPRRSGIVEVRGRNLGLPPVSRTAWPAGRYGATVRRCPGRPALPGCTRRGPGPRPGPRGAASLWGLFPAGPSSSTLAPSPLEGRVCGSCPEPGPVNARQLRRTTQLQGGRRWSLIGPARPAPASRARRPPRRCSLSSTAHTPAATGVSGSSLATARSWATAALPAVQSARPAPPQQTSKRDPSPTQESAPGRPAVGSRRPETVAAVDLPAASARQRDQDPLEDAPAGRMRGCSSPGWAVALLPGDLVRPGLGR